jgi:catechol 2,3-dioxygenase-like lactoylglutathione lyase family enzyme
MDKTRIKRTTMIVRNAERMKQFYEDVFQWRVYYDSSMRVTGKIIPTVEPSAEVQLYIMERDDQEIGKIGILEWTDPPLPESSPTYSLEVGDVVFVADSDDIHALAARIEADPDARIHCAPRDYTFPAPDGSGDIELTSMSFFDPEGFLHEAYYRHNRPNPDGYLIRRVTTVVQDMERTAAFYMEAMGLELYQDGEMALDQQTLPVGGEGARVRLAVYRSEDPYIGMVGALQFLNTDIGVRDKTTLGVGDVVFVGGTEEPDALFERIQQAGVRVTCEPFSRAVPKSGGDGEIPMVSMGFCDPDGQLWEVNQR